MFLLVHKTVYITITNIITIITVKMSSPSQIIYYTIIVTNTKNFSLIVVIAICYSKHVHYFDIYFIYFILIGIILCNELDSITSSNHTIE